RAPPVSSSPPFPYTTLFRSGFPATTLGTGGATRDGIDKIGAGIVGRGVLLDIARARGVERLRAGEVISPDDLDAAERAQGVRIRSKEHTSELQSLRHLVCRL